MYFCGGSSCSSLFPGSEFCFPTLISELFIYLKIYSTFLQELCVCVYVYTHTHTHIQITFCVVFPIWAQVYHLCMVNCLHIFYSFLLKTVSSLFTHGFCKSYLWGTLLISTFVFLPFCIKFLTCLSISVSLFFPILHLHTLLSHHLLSEYKFFLLLCLWFTSILMSVFTQPVTSNKFPRFLVGCTKHLLAWLAPMIINMFLHR